eukprot:gene7425-19508_t
MFSKDDLVSRHASGTNHASLGPQSGCEYAFAVLERGVGRLPVAKEVVVCHYTGTLASDGTKFDCSKDRGKPLTFMIGIGQVIKGWDEGIMSMHLGEISKLEISSAFAYGEAGSGGKIPPAADLVFEVELLKIGDEKAPSISGGGLAGFGQCTKVFDQCTIA